MTLTAHPATFIPRQTTADPGTFGVGPGYRLARLEALNWGTFHRTNCAFNVDGRSVLLTGGVGSGKSTLVDAMTTLLLPAHKIAYNKAAGAEAKERDLRSYVLGHHKNERVEATGSTRPVGLRDASSYSVILGVFTNYALNTHLTLAQVFYWTSESSTGQPERFYLTADAPLSIDTDFTGFGTDIADLRRQLKQRGATIHGSTYTQYGKALRRGLGIPSEQALDLFHQTVSMKAVGSLDEFVRDRMLEPFNAAAEVDKIVGHFDALTASHDQVVLARQMIQGLDPIVEACKRHGTVQDEIAALTERREAVPAFFAQHRQRLLEKVHTTLTADTANLKHLQSIRETNLERLRETADGLRRRIDGVGGQTLLSLANRIDSSGRERDQRRKQADAYSGWLAQASLEPVTDAASFHERSGEIATAQAQAVEQEEIASQELGALAVARRDNTAATDEIRREITSLQQQRSSIPAALLDLRRELAASVGVAGEDLPFSGELIQVRDDEAAWAGAAERVLRGFALSLLVPHTHYPAVSAWVNGRHLGLRLVYYHVPAHTASTVLPGDRTVLAGKLELKDDSWAHDWLAAQLGSRADYLCAEDLETFNRATRPAVTRQGLVKSGGGRHEKNDAHRIDDRSKWVLGWSNQAKLEALLDEAGRLTRDSSSITTRTREIQGQQKARASAVAALTLLGTVDDYTALDWHSVTAQIEQLEQQKKALEAEAGLDKLTGDLKQIEADIEQSRQDFSAGQEELGGLRRDGQHIEAQLNKTTAFLATCDLDAITKHQQALTPLLPQTADDDQGHLELLELKEREAEAQLLHTSTSRHTALRRIEGQAAALMSAFRGKYPVHTTELDNSIESAQGYQALHERLTDEDLPRFEERFLEYLRTNVIRDIAGFQAKLGAQEGLIRERIDLINTSLAAIDYNPGRYVRLNAAATLNVEIRDFQRDLRACTTDVLATDTDTVYTEEKFLQVKRLLDRFKGRQDLTRVDADWTARVTDVRRWFVFSASELNRADDTEHEVYSDSGGKSGGQKEKLAYTILAYQFRIDPNDPKAKTFHFVVIDEAFGRGDDASAHFALGLFQRLGLQLLVVTPLQKLHVIEPHVTRVGYVDRQGSRSRLATLTIEEYQAQKKAAHQASSTIGEQP
jgi:uncharacterized protein YPO0396